MPRLTETVPAHVVPPAQSLPTLTYLRRLIRNPLEVWPEAIYREKTYRETFLGRETVFVMDPDLVKQVLVVEPDKFRKSDLMLRLLRPALGNGLLNADGTDWRKQRRIVAPMFRPDRIARFVPTMLSTADRTAARIAALADGSVVEVWTEMMQTTFEVIAETILTGADRLDLPKVEAAIGDYLGGTSWVIALAQLGLPERFPFPGRGRVMRARNYLRAITSEMVAERRRGQPRDDLIQALVDARDEDTGEGISDEEVVDNLLTFIAAGHETTALALTWTLYLLARHPEAEAKVLAEIAAVGGPQAITAAQVAGLGYTRQVVQEAMRLYPSAPTILRTPTEEIGIGDLRTGPRTSIFIPIYAIHRHRALWDNPNVFDPDRFAPEHAKARHPFAYLPFGGGPRVCIGMGFSLLEAVAILARILPRLEFSPAGETPVPVARVTLRPNSMMPMIVRRRAAIPARAA